MTLHGCLTQRGPEGYAAGNRRLSLSQLTQAERLALAVRAEVTRVRAEEASDRAALLDRQLAPLLEARQRFFKRYQRDPDLEREHDRDVLFALIARTEGVKLTKEHVD